MILVLPEIKPHKNEIKRLSEMRVLLWDPFEDFRQMTNLKNSFFEVFGNNLIFDKLRFFLKFKL